MDPSVGDAVGPWDAVSVGSADSFDGTDDVEGAGLSPNVGAGVGRSVGCSEGEPEGVVLGALEGDDDGVELGKDVGTGLGDSDAAEEDACWIRFL